jgi:hypothetical protein
MREGMLRTLLPLLLCVVPAAQATQSSALELPAGVWSPDQGDGHYANPILAGDYSDPDVVRVGEDYYLTSSSFTNTPGLPVLHSRDLVNWTLIGHALMRQVPDAHHGVPRRGGGVWAPAIRHHNGLFRIYYPDPDFGIFLVTAEDPAGPWSNRYWWKMPRASSIQHRSGTTMAKAGWRIRTPNRAREKSIWLR